MDSASGGTQNGPPLLHIYGDSSVIINWANNKASLTSLELNDWCDNTRTLMDGFAWLDIRHVYWEHNESENSLSKDALNLTPGILCFSEVLMVLFVRVVNLSSFRAMCQSLTPFLSGTQRLVSQNIIVYGVDIFGSAL